MVDITQLQIPDDRFLIDNWLGPLATACVSGADECQVFDAWQSQGQSVSAVAAALKLDETAFVDLCRVLVAMGLLQVDNDSFSLTQAASSYSVSTSPLYRGSALLLHHASDWHRRVVKTLKEGWAPLMGGGESFTAMWESGQLNTLAAAPFTHWMHALSFTAAISVARSGIFDKVSHLLDIGGGSGALSIALVKHCPHIAVTLFDLPPVCDEAKQYIAQYNVTEKITLTPGHFFKDPWPKAEAMSLCNILHDWQTPQCVTLLEQAYASLPMGGQIFIYDTLLNETRTAPQATTLLNFFMRMNHKGQMFSQGEIAQLLETTGFNSPEVVHTYGYYAMIRAYK